MTKLPSYLKGLVESRARSAGDIERLEQLRALLEEELVAARKRLDSADVLIREYSPLLDPTAIAPVQRRKGRYGAHGNLKETLVQVLEEAAPKSLPTMEVAFRAAMALQVKFETVEVHRQWAMNSVHPQLRRLMLDGVIERIQGESRGHETRWRAAPKAAEVGGLASLKDLHARRGDAD